MLPVDTCAARGSAARASTARAQPGPLAHVFMVCSFFSDGLVSRGAQIGRPRTDGDWGRGADMRGIPQAPLVHPPDDGLQALPEGRQAVLRPPQAFAHDASRDEPGP